MHITIISLWLLKYHLDRYQRLLRNSLVVVYLFFFQIKCKSVQKYCAVRNITLVVLHFI